ncbi:MAG: 16S rRNA (guanine(527)-N(7))-methyltransferase RsmG [Oscillospiraceae bacterium]|nr:16S rRNA (guanine(527)-N(7))-methyltransferase RsmG [Oscillospiraceae bacterium]
MRDTLTRGLPELGVSTQHIDALEEFSRLLVAKNEVMNLTGITQPKEVATLHLLDSLSLIPLSELAGKKMIDVGTGAGFPGVPLKIALPDAEVTLLDSLNKRVEFLRESCDQLGLSGVECVHARAEEFGHREEYDYAVSRAVAALPVLCELCLPFVKVGGEFLAMKSSHTEEEIAQAKSAITMLGGKITEVIDYTIPTTEIVHRVIRIEKIKPTPKKYPRRFAQIKKQPLGQ